MTLFAASMLTTGVQAAVVPSTGYSVSTVLTGRTYSAFDVYSSSGSSYVTGWTGGRLKQYSLTTGAETADLGAAPDGYGSLTGVTASYVVYNPTDGSTWVGYSNNDNPSNAKIFKVSAGGDWEEVTSLTNNYSLVFYGTQAFAMADSTIYWVDSATGATTAFAQIGGNSSQLALSADGLLVGSYGLDTNYLLSYDNSLLDSFLYNMENDLGWTALGLADADELLTYSVGGAGGLAVGEDGDIYYTSNDADSGDSLVAQYEGDTMGTGEFWAAWVSYIDTLDGDVYYTLYGEEGISVLGAVPEPQTYALLGGAAALLFTLYYRRRKLG